MTPHCQCGCEACAEHIRWLEDRLAYSAADERMQKLRARYPDANPQPLKLALVMYDRNGRIVGPYELDEVLPPRVHDIERDGFTHMKVMVNRLRKRIGYDSIETVAGLGYRMTESGRAHVAGILTSA